MFLKILDRLEEIFISLLMAGATLLIFVAVLHRYGSTVPFLFPYLHEIDMTWAQELCIYMFVWMAKFGAAYGVRNGTHVGVDVLVRTLPPERAKYLILFGMLAGALFTGVVGTLGASFVWDNGFHYALFHRLGIAVGELPEGPTSPDLEIPTWIAYSCVPLGSYLMSYRFLQTAGHFWRTGEAPHAAHAVAGVDDAALDDADHAAPVSGAQK